MPVMNSVVEPWRLRGLLLADAGDVVGEVEALARVEQVADDHADRERDGRHRQEVGQREPADLADAGRAAHGARRR